MFLYTLIVLKYTQFLLLFPPSILGYSQIDELLRQRNEIYASYTIAPPMKRSSSRSRNKGQSKEVNEEGQVRDKKSTFRDRSKRKKWFNIHLKVDKRKPC